MKPTHAQIWSQLSSRSQLDELSISVKSNTVNSKLDIKLVNSQKPLCLEIISCPNMDMDHSQGNDQLSISVRVLLIEINWIPGMFYRQCLEITLPGDTFMLKIMAKLMELKTCQSLLIYCAQKLKLFLSYICIILTTCVKECCT